MHKQFKDEQERSVLARIISQYVLMFGWSLKVIPDLVRIKITSTPTSHLAKRRACRQRQLPKISTSESECVCCCVFLRTQICIPQSHLCLEAHTADLMLQSVDDTLISSICC